MYVEIEMVFFQLDRCTSHFTYLHIYVHVYSYMMRLTSSMGGSARLHQGQRLSLPLWWRLGCHPFLWMIRDTSGKFETHRCLHFTNIYIYMHTIIQYLYFTHYNICIQSINMCIKFKKEKQNTNLIIHSRFVRILPSGDWFRSISQYPMKYHGTVIRVSLILNKLFCDDPGVVIFILASIEQQIKVCPLLSGACVAMNSVLFTVIGSNNPSNSLVYNKPFVGAMPLASQAQCLLLVLKNPISFSLGDLPFWNFDPFEILLSPRGSFMEPLLISLLTKTAFPKENLLKFDNVENSWSLHDHFHQFSISIWLYKMWNHWIEGFCRSWNSRKNLETWTPLFLWDQDPSFHTLGAHPSSQALHRCVNYVIYIYKYTYGYYMCMCIYIYMASPRVYHIQHTSIHMTWVLFPLSARLSLPWQQSTPGRGWFPFWTWVRAASQGRSWENDGLVVQNSGFS